jgi:aryl-alcohol dehydrogenase-like predicted oxidoreductase
MTHKINYQGNNAKSMYLSVDASLKKLRTSYIDIFYVHVWDFETSIEEVMNNLHNLVVSGKVLYLVTNTSFSVSVCMSYTDFFVFFF